MSKAILIGACGGDFSPKKGIDYWTPEDVESINRIVRDKSSMIGGFIPVRAPIWKDGAKLNATLATVTSINEEDGETVIIFNEKEEIMDDGGFEGYKDGDRLVYIDSAAKTEKGWSGIEFCDVDRYAIIKSSPEAHSGNNYVAVKCPRSSIFKSLKLKPHTNYIISYWVKGMTNDVKHHLTIGAKSSDSNVYYTDLSNYANWGMDKASYNAVLLEQWYNSLVSAKEDSGWQRIAFQFRTRDDVYVDICLHFNQATDEYGLDDFSVFEATGDELTAFYAAGVSVPEVIKVGAVFYVESNGDSLTRFDYASSVAIANIYGDLESKMAALLEATLLSPILNGDEVSY